MATASTNECVVEIGEAAGVIWKILDESGPASVAQLVKSSEKSRDLVMQGLGWLAREDKIEIKEVRRSRMVSLR
ncbi:MAG: winged helix-turn-helix domain-containing protein [Pirellulaceae bacterium]|nr:winged helix-turn-helix domain-containing protein [Pirellulaceae bacterium]